MSFKSQSLAKTLLAVSVVIASISSYYANNWRTQLQSATASVAQAEQSFRASNQAFNELSELLVPNETTLSIEKALTEVVLQIYNMRVAHGISVTSATPSVAGGNDAVDMVSLTQGVPNTNSVKSILINVRGTYSSYLGLLDYIKALQKNQLSVVFFELKEHSFELNLRIYGETSES